MKVVPGPKRLNAPSITHGETKTSRSTLVYSINQWAARFHVSELRLLSAMANPFQLPSASPSRLMLLSQDKSCILNAGQSRGRATLETHFWFVYWGKADREGAVCQEVFSEDANIEFKLDAKSSLQVFRVEILWSGLLSPVEAEWLSHLITNWYWLSRTWAQQTAQVQVTQVGEQSEYLVCAFLVYKYFIFFFSSWAAAKHSPCAN